MLVEIFKELILELLRALFLEEFCQRIKDAFMNFVRPPRRGGLDALLRELHGRHAKRLLHRITTLEDKKL